MDQLASSSCSACCGTQDKRECEMPHADWKEAVCIYDCYRRLEACSVWQIGLKLLLAAGPVTEISVDLLTMKWHANTETSG